MSRSSPKVILQYVEKKTYIQEHILESHGIWAVYYNNKPFNLKSSHYLKDGPIKYKKVSFSNPGHAHNLCKKLNQKFQTDKFTVVLLTEGKTVS